MFISLIDALPVWYQYTWVVLFGLIIGSFLNVVIYRYHTGKSLSGHSHCLSCAKTLRWYDLIPLLSYVILKGRCRACGSYIPLRYFLVESMTAVLFLLTYLYIPVSILLPLSLLLVAVLVVVAVYDIYHMIIPNELVVVTGILAILLFVGSYYDQFSLQTLAYHAGAAVGAFLFYGGLWFISKGKWIGFGDAKLAIPLGFILGVPAVFSFIVLSFWIGAGISILLLMVPQMIKKIKTLLHLIHERTRYTHAPMTKNQKSLTMKSEVPFAPFMIVAFLLVYLFHVDVLALVAFTI